VRFNDCAPWINPRFKNHPTFLWSWAAPCINYSGGRGVRNALELLQRRILAFCHHMAAVVVLSALAYALGDAIKPFYATRGAGPIPGCASGTDRRRIDRPSTYSSNGAMVLDRRTLS
jgi:hypothetical protein